MRVAGIIAEFNPLHNGHVYLIDKIREELGPDTPVVIIMSGDFVQRGQPALCDRAARTAAALQCSADIVLEMPFTFATGSADRFAKGGVLSLLGSGVVTDLYFGAEHDSLSDLSKIASTNFESDPVFRETLSEAQKDGLSYAASWESAASKVIGSLSDPDLLSSFSSIIKNPNNTLAIAYLRELKKTDSSITPHLIRRESDYNDEELHQGIFPSASAIRKKVLQEHFLGKSELFASASDLTSYIPVPMLAEMLNSWGSGTIPMGEDQLIEAAFPILSATSVSSLSDTAHMGEMLASHLKNSISTMHYKAGSPIGQTFYQTVNTRCFSYTRIMRALTSLVIGQKEEDLQVLLAPKYLRLLGFSERGRGVLKTMREQSQLPILSRASDARHYGKDPVFSRMNELDRISHDFWTFRARGTWEEDFRFEVIQYKRKKIYR